MEKVFWNYRLGAVGTDDFAFMVCTLLRPENREEFRMLATADDWAALRDYVKSWPATEEGWTALLRERHHAGQWNTETIVTYARPGVETFREMLADSGGRTRD